MDLELATAEELLTELCKRYSALVVVGVHRENIDDITTVVMGPAYMCLGLVEQISMELDASVNKPLE